MSTRPTDTHPSLLPPQATELERDIEQATVRATDIPTPMDTIWNADTCPPALLGWLAWAVSVDEWNPDWPDQVKRDAIKTAPLLHKRKGTLWALEYAMASLRVTPEVTEWWQTTPISAPGTFVLTAVVDLATVAGDIVNTLKLQVDKVKPVSRQYTIRLKTQTSSNTTLASVTTPAAVMQLTTP